GSRPQFLPLGADGAHAAIAERVEIENCLSVTGTNDDCPMQVAPCNTGGVIIGMMKAAVLLFLGGTLALAQEDHSLHQHAAGLGTVSFPTSCNPPSQKLISRCWKTH